MRHIIMILSLCLSGIIHAGEMIFPHDRDIDSVAFAPDGQHILTGSEDKTAILWDLQGKKVQVFRHYDLVWSVAFSPDGKHILTGLKDKTAILWDLQGKNVQVFQHDDAVLSVAFAPDGQHILTGSADNTAVLWDLQGKKVQVFRHDDKVWSVAFAPDGKHILTGSSDETAILWDLQGNKQQVFRHDDLVRSVAFAPDGKHILTGSDDNTAILWDLQGNKQRVFRHDGSVHSVAFAPDGKDILTSSYGTAILWDLQSKKEWWFSRHNYFFRSVAFSPDGKAVLIASGETAYLYSLLPYQFPNNQANTDQHLTTTEVATMARLGAKIRYDGEESLHALTAYDAPAQVVQAVELDLSNLFLDELPAWFGKFRQLRYLNLSDNQLKLPQLAVLRQLDQLENLDLSHNPVFRGATGDGGLFSYLPNLLRLNLAETGLNSLDWEYIRLPKLLTLDLADNPLTTLTLSNQPRLRELNAESNRIEHFQLQGLSALQELNLNGNRLKILNFANLPDGLLSLWAENNGLERIDFQRKSDLPQLERLYLRNNNNLTLPDAMGATFVLQNLRICEVDSSVRVPEGLRRKLESFKQ